MTRKNDAREFDIVVYGATGFTGRLVAEYLAAASKGGEAFAWALAGRDADRLAQVRDSIGAPADLPLIVADGGAPDALEAMARRTRVALTTVGPYQLYGSALVAACAATGAGYVDLCGEPSWMRAMIDAHEAQARQSGARIVFSCGFDSIPFDLGVFRAQARFRERFGAPAPKVRGFVRKMRGTFSGGTKASMEATVAAARADPGLAALLRSPFALTPGFEGAPQPSDRAAEYDEKLGVWLAPFVMAVVNTRNVHRTNLLLDFPWGRDFVYDERLMTGPGERGEAIARKLAGDKSGGMGAEKKPGEGPDRESQQEGFYDLLFIAEGPDGREVRVNVHGDRDPGYSSTSRMIAEAALCLARDGAAAPGGVYTPASAFGDRLIERLEARAGLRFSDES